MKESVWRKIWSRVVNEFEKEAKKDGYFKVTLETLNGNKTCFEFWPDHKNIQKTANNLLSSIAAVALKRYAGEVLLQYFRKSVHDSIPR